MFYDVLPIKFYYVYLRKLACLLPIENKIHLNKIFLLFARNCRQLCLITKNKTEINKNMSLNQMYKITDSHTPTITKLIYHE